MFLRGLVRIRTQNPLSWKVDVAVAPRGGRRRIGPDSARRPNVRYLPGSVASEVSLVGPEGFVLVEIAGKEHVDRQCLRSGRWTGEGRRVAPSPASPLRLRLRSGRRSPLRRCAPLSGQN